MSSQSRAGLASRSFRAPLAPSQRWFVFLAMLTACVQRPHPDSGPNASSRAPDASRSLALDGGEPLDVERIDRRTVATGPPRDVERGPGVVAGGPTNNAPTPTRNAAPARTLRCARAVPEPGPALPGWTTHKIGATTWAAVAIAASDANDVWMVGNDGALLHTHDGGTTYERCSMTPSDALSAISVVTPNDVWILGESQVHHVANATVETLTFTLEGHCGVPSNGIAADADHVWIANGGHHRSDDRGKTWTRIAACGGPDVSSSCASELSIHGHETWSDCSFGITGAADGIHWLMASFNTGTEEQLHVGVGPDEVWVVGQDTRIVAHAINLRSSRRTAPDGGRVDPTWSHESLGRSAPGTSERLWSVTSAGRGWAWLVASDGLWVRPGKPPWLRETKTDVVRAVAAGPRAIWAVGKDGFVAHRPAPR